MSAQVEDSSPPGQYYCPQCEKNFAFGERCPTDGSKLVRLGVVLDPMLGRDIDGRFTIIEKLGQGGMGAVYRASQPSLSREVAIKVISAHLVTDGDVVKRFLREAKLASRLAHPNAVAVLEFDQTHDGLIYLVMELVRGQTLDAVIKAEKQLRADRVVRIGMQVCDALEGAHSLSIVHRDLKPANIMLLAKGRDLVKVLDFGLAKVVGPDQTTATMTNAGALLGTPAFMPPELALGQACDGRSDLYSLGVVLYLAGSGRLPFMSESPHELIAMHGTEAAPPMTGVPPALAAVIDRMLQKDPGARFQSAAENREALEAALEGRFTPVPGMSIVSGASILVQSGVAVGEHAKVAAMRTLAPNELDRAAAAPSVPEIKRRSRVVPLLAGLVVAGGLAAGGYMMFLRPGVEPVNEVAPPKTDPQPPPKTDPQPPPKTDPQPVTVDPPKPDPQLKADVPIVDPTPKGEPIVDDTAKKHPAKPDGKKHGTGKVKSTGNVKAAPKETPKEIPKEIPKETPKEVPKEATVPKETPKSGSAAGSGKMPF